MAQRESVSFTPARWSSWPPSSRAPGCGHQRRRAGRADRGHVRDEVYYREALAMGLDQNDPQVRQRMRLKLEFLLEDLTAEEAPGDELLSAYLQQHADKFRVEPQVSFRQLYLNPDKRRDLARPMREACWPA